MRGSRKGDGEGDGKATEAGGIKGEEGGTKEVRKSGEKGERFLSFALICLGATPWSDRVQERRQEGCTSG